MPIVGPHRTHPLALGSRRDNSLFLRLSLFMVGFSIPFPGLLIPGLVYSPRYTDLFVMVAIPFVWGAYGRMRSDLAAPKMASFWLAAIIVPLVVHYLTYHAFQVADAAYYTRWIIAIILAAPLVFILPERPELQTAFLLGLVVGAGGHLGTLIVASLGGKSFLLSVGMASPRLVTSSYSGESRVTSLSEHPNNAMILIALSVPAAVAYRLIAPKGKGLWTIAIAGVFLVYGFYFTLTRGATIAAIAAIAVGLIQFMKRSDKTAIFARGVFLVLAVLIIFLALQASSFQIGADRLLDRVASDGLNKNLDGRWHTVEATLLLLMEQPLGTGWGQYVRRVALADGLSATHNGYLFTARIMGLPLLALIAVGHIRVLWRAASTRRIDALPPIAIFIVAVGFAEDITQGMSMVFMVTFLAMSGLHYAPWASTIYRSAPILFIPRNRLAGRPQR